MISASNSLLKKPESARDTWSWGPPTAEETSERCTFIVCPTVNVSSPILCLLFKATVTLPILINVELSVIFSTTPEISSPCLSE